MTITTFVQSAQRTRVAHVGPIPQQAHDELERRGFQVVLLEESHLQTPGILDLIDSVFFFQDENKPNRVAHELETFTTVLLAYDCRIYVQHLPVAPYKEDGDYGRRYILNAIKGQKLPTFVYSLDEVTRGSFEGTVSPIDRHTYSPCIYIVPNPCDWRELANTIKSNPAGVAPNSSMHVELPSFDGDNPADDPERKLLIQRAFHDCEKVEFTLLGNGLSGVATYRVFAELQGGVIPVKRPYVLFVKLGMREKIEKEHYNYQHSAMGHVPFHLGPRLKLERCALGHKFGILVSDFVSGSEALKDCASGGRAAAAIGNLFSTTLASWRSAARVETRTLAVELADKLQKEIPDHRRDAMLSYGASLDLEIIRNTLNAVGPAEVLMGVVHGDLHATNVLVRGNDAIIIDFEKIELNKPILLDAASLEAGLFVDGFIGDRRNGEEVLRSVDKLYSKKALSGEIQSCHPKDGSGWFFDCVRQIRLHAHTMERSTHQYALTLACLFVKKACNEEDFSDPKADPERLTRENVRAMSMVIAQRIFAARSVES